MTEGNGNHAIAALSAVRDEISKAVVGNDTAVLYLVLALLCRGRVLLEGVPGVAKTLLVRALRTSVWRTAGVVLGALGGLVVDGCVLRVLDRGDDRLATLEALREQCADLPDRILQIAVALPMDADRTRGGAIEVEHHAHRGGFAGAIGPQEPGDLAIGNLKGEVVYCCKGTVFLGKLCDCEHGFILALSRREVTILEADLVVHPWG